MADTFDSIIADTIGRHPKIKALSEVVENNAQVLDEHDNKIGDISSVVENNAQVLSAHEEQLKELAAVVESHSRDLGELDDELHTEKEDD